MYRDMSAYFYVTCRAMYRGLALKVRDHILLLPLSDERCRAFFRQVQADRKYPLGTAGSGLAKSS